MPPRARFPALGGIIAAVHEGASQTDGRLGPGAEVMVLITGGRDAEALVGDPGRACWPRRRPEVPVVVHGGGSGESSRAVRAHGS